MFVEPDQEAVLGKIAKHEVIRQLTTSTCSGASEQ
jgi:hypothetical protein